MEIAGLVSVVIPFLNPDERFLREAVESVILQSYPDWEIILVDDGSREGSGLGVARSFARDMADRVRLVSYQTPGNRGASAARNEGLKHVRGEYVALLDADDVWLPHKLELEVDTLLRNPAAEMVFTNTCYWYSWTGTEDGGKDFVPAFGEPGLYAPPGPLAQWLRGESAVPSTCSLTVRRHTLEILNGFEDGFPGLYDDQVLYAKVCLRNPVVLVDQVTAWYRQHPASMCSTAGKAEEKARRQAFLVWLREQTERQGMSDPDLRAALRTELWRARNPQLALAARWLRKLAPVR